jgi:cyclopropane fatty-acyl-phospholipid synthase-like methyltransferase
MSLKSRAQGLFFEGFYRTQTPPWVIDRPQPSLVDIEAEGLLHGRSVLDVGCGTGDNAIYLAQKQFHVVGIDAAQSAIKIAKQRAQEASIAADFHVLDVFAVAKLQQSFDTVVDFGLFHQFSGHQRNQYIDCLASVLKPNGILILQCFSDQEPSREVGPQRLSQQDIYDAFASGWQVNWIRATQYYLNGREPHHDWLTSVERSLGM